jgi:hypothetical protein
LTIPKLVFRQRYQRENIISGSTWYRGDPDGSVNDVRRRPRRIPIENVVLITSRTNTFRTDVMTTVIGIKYQGAPNGAFALSPCSATNRELRWSFLHCIYTISQPRNMESFRIACKEFRSLFAALCILFRRRGSTLRIYYSVLYPMNLYCY